MKTAIDRYIINRDGTKEVWYKSGLIRHYGKTWKPSKTVQKVISEGFIYMIYGNTIFKSERDYIFESRSNDRNAIGKVIRNNAEV